MSFFLKINDDKMAFGGIQSIPQDYGFISQTRGRVFVGDDGEITSPIGIWSIGSSVRANHALGYLRPLSVIHEDKLLYLADSRADLQILVATETKLHIYQGGNHTWLPIEDGFLYFGLNVPRVDAEQYIASIECGCCTPKGPWSVTTTYIERY